MKSIVQKKRYLPHEMSTKINAVKHLGHYETPTALGNKWQMDVKYVPQACYVGKDDERFFQYTMLEEASRERSIYAYKEQSSFSTIDFVNGRLATLYMHLRQSRRTTAPNSLTAKRRTVSTHLISPVLKTALSISKSAPNHCGITVRRNAATAAIRSVSIITCPSIPTMFAAPNEALPTVCQSYSHGCSWL